MSEMKPPMEGKTEKRQEREIEIAAPLDVVWRALTDGKELANWFPLEARVTPGLGGKIFLSWGPGCEGEGEIVAWEPGKRYAWKEPFAIVEWSVEARGGKTVVRMVQSAFLGNVDWEDEWFESTDYGWSFMLASLKWALERHPGVERKVAWLRQQVTISREEAYRRLISTGGIFAEDFSSLGKPGGEYSATTALGDRFSGRIEFVKQDRGFCLTVRELNDALLWLIIEGAAGKLEVQAWLSAFGLPDSEVERFRERWVGRLKQLFQ